MMATAKEACGVNGASTDDDHDLGLEWAPFFFRRLCSKDCYFSFLIRLKLRVIEKFLALRRKRRR